MATQKRLGDCSVYSELLRMGQRCQLGGTGLTAYSGFSMRKRKGNNTASVTAVPPTF